MPLPRPGLAPELHALLADLPLRSELGLDALAEVRPYSSQPVDTVLDGRAVDHRELTISTPDNAALPLSIFTPATADRATPAPCVYWIHGGGMVMGDRYSQLDIPLDWLDAFGAVVVSVDYRLAPEATGTAPVDDCYRGLVWTAEHAADLGIDPDRVIVAGTSAGGGLAAGITLMARDLGTPSIAAQVLVCPMLDHRNNTTSSRQYSGDPGVWTREMNEFGWRSLLGDLADEDVEYASRIWAAGGQAELHIRAGGFHGFDALYPQAQLSAAARRTRTEWLARVLNEHPRDPC